MSAYLVEFITVAFVHVLAVMVPGPDFVLVSRQSIGHSRRAGVYTAVGLSLGIMMHVFYSLVGIGFIIAQSIWLFSVIKLLGAGYLILIGYRAIRARPDQERSVVTEEKEAISIGAAIRQGFGCNILNPKVTIFFLSLFTQVISPHTPLLVQIGYGLEMVLMTLLWFTLVATVVTHRTIRARFGGIQKKVERALGGVLIALGIKVALTARQ